MEALETSTHPLYQTNASLGNGTGWVWATTRTIYGDSDPRLPFNEKYQKNCTDEVTNA
jgi:hypothetical protein